jgi:AcrR family transcriptional regulator
MSAAERRAELVQAALRVIATQGVAAATTRAIVAEADMPLASFHYAFRSRDELIAELIAFVVDNQSLAAAAMLTPGADLATLIRQGLHAFLQVVAGDPLREQAMFELVQYALRTPELGPSARLQYDSYYQAATAILAYAAEQTGSVWTVPIADVARIIVTLTDGLTMTWLVDRDTAACQRVIDFAATSIAQLATPSAPDATPSPASLPPASKATPS